MADGKQRRAAGAFGLAALLAAGCGCASSHALPTAHASGSPGTVGVPTDSPTIALPLDAFVMTPQQTSSLLNAYQLLLARCVRASGFSFRTEDASNAAASTVNAQTRFGLNSLQDARIYGYEPDAARRAADARARSEPVYSDAEDVVIFGKTTNGRPPKTPAGCSGQAWSQLGNTGPDGASYASTPFAVSLEERAHASTESDARVAAVNAQWSACMRQRGYAFTDPAAASGSPRWRQAAAAAQSDAPPMPAPAEIATAVADVQCKRSTDYVGTLTRVDTGYQNRLIDQNLAALQAEKSRRDAVLEKAAQVLAGR